ncbi:uncharacterized protein LY89DRAFT_759958 [Mollisia scopiformis]|uniref:Uncharacterized protein n=1 Tax=Mollisia scopiformis TaxID=149040 RepID=A0A194WTH3_MOLSC|nr:uncharacterized protein LY89DRAFT_759958 [Mollisia scopiformis]KUJ10969.1 hypothetical protein LY89DRAFT_759958 [Mollisia scopiformis]
MAPTTAEVEKADRLRLEGNELYKENKLLKAIQKYRESAKLVPNDAVPLGNLSAAYYEIMDKDMPTQPDFPNGLLEYLTPIFIDTAKAMKKLKGRFQIEAMVGDALDLCESLRFILYHDAADPSATAAIGTRPKEFPVLFDRVHLSNIPDYMCGNLSACLFVPPLPKSISSSHWQQCCLRKGNLFDSYETYLAEYQRITDPTMLKQLTQVKMISEFDDYQPMVEYLTYKVADILPMSHGKLLPKAPFFRWFYALFFRLALPFEYDGSGVNLIIYTPLNLTVLFHLLAHLKTLGYPAHCLSDVLLAIIENKVVTTSRSPRSSPALPEDVEYDNPERKLSTAPFSYEMKTLAVMFQNQHLHSHCHRSPYFLKAFTDTHSPCLTMEHTSSIIPPRP